MKHPPLGRTTGMTLATRSVAPLAFLLALIFWAVPPVSAQSPDPAATGAASTTTTSTTTTTTTTIPSATAEAAANTSTTTTIIAPATATAVDTPEQLLKGDTPIGYAGPVVPETPPPPPGPLQSAGVIVEGLVYDIPMPWGDPDFESFRNIYTSPAGKKWLLAVMAGSMPYLSYVVERVKHYNLPEELIYLPVVESEYIPGAVSRSGATGMWQFMKNSIAGYGMKIDEWVDERRDFMKSTDGALRKLADNFKEFGDWPLAVAAYNAGSGAVGRAMAKTGLEKPTVSDLKAQGLISQETLGYVPKFLAIASILRYPELHGLPVSWGQPSTWQALPTSRPVDLSLLAELADISIDTLKAGNPELRGIVTPPTANHFIKVPSGKAEAAKAVLDDTSRPLIRFYTYKVKSGDNLGAISRHYKIPIESIVKANPGLNPDKIKVDQTLIIPAYANIDVSKAVAVAASTAKTQIAAPETTETHKIMKGDTLEFTGTHTVAKGDTLWNISQRFGIQPELLAEKNGLTLNSIIRIGQKLAVPVLN